MKTQNDSTASLLTWNVQSDAGTTTVRFAGEIDEFVDFSRLQPTLAGSVIFDLADVRRINSCGVREWVRFVRDLPLVTDLVLARCSQPIVRQLNMIHNFTGPATVASVMAPYHCGSCESEAENLLDIPTSFPGKVIGEIPEFPCPQCETIMEFDEIPERYLLFVTR